MRFFNLVPTRPVVCLVLSCLASQASAYFMITEPTQTTAWVNGAANLVTWTKGLQDGIDAFDVEMSRLSSDGLTFVAQGVPSTAGSLNIFLQDIPAGDDYFLLFINSTHGVMYATSPRFTILASNASPPSNATTPSPDKSAATVTVSGAPNPTQVFATTFPAVANGVHGGWSRVAVGANEMWAMGTVAAGCIMGAMWTMW